MKKLVMIGLVSVLFILSICNRNDNKDSVDKANAANDKKDTTSMTSDAKKDTMSAMPVNEDVAKFAVKAANAGMAEVKLGGMAETKAVDKEVKDFGSMMVKDHTKAGDELKNLASEKNITLPTSVSDDTQKHIDDLDKKTGKDFDKDYMHMMVSDHKDVIDAFEDAAKNSKDSAFKNFAVKTLPTLYKHLGAAKAIEKSKHY
jgi:putative membrane protein